MLAPKAFITEEKDTTPRVTPLSVAAVAITDAMYVCCWMVNAANAARFAIQQECV